MTIVLPAPASIRSSEQPRQANPKPTRNSQISRTPTPAPVPQCTARQTRESEPAHRGHTLVEPYLRSQLRKASQNPMAAARGVLPLLREEEGLDGRGEGRRWREGEGGLRGGGGFGGAGGRAYFIWRRGWMGRSDREAGGGRREGKEQGIIGVHQSSGISWPGGVRVGALFFFFFFLLMLFGKRIGLSTSFVNGVSPPNRTVIS